MENICKSENGIYAIEKLHSSGFEAGFVGGCVRDAIMHKKSNDFDITTNATPNEIKYVFKDFNTLDIGIKHGTVVVIINEELLEITTYRIDGVYSDGRHPDNVSFTRNLIDDLSRRDFTINAIFFNDRNGLIDPFNGKQDIENKIIKTVGSPDKRFKEDGLRIMRAVRFASTLSFNIEENTKVSIHKNTNLLNNVSIERITNEFMKLLMGNNFFYIMNDYRDVISCFIPELKETFDFNQNNPYHKYDVFMHTLHSMTHCNTLKLRLTMLFHDIGKPKCYFKDKKGIGHFYGHPSVSYKMAKNIFMRIKISTYENLNKKDINDILTLIKYHDLEIRPERKIIKRIFFKLKADSELFLDFLAIKSADNLAKSNLKNDGLIENIEKIKVIFNNILKENMCFSLKDLKINGNDLKNKGFYGKNIGIALNSLLKDVIDEKIPNNKDALLKQSKLYKD